MLRKLHRRKFLSSCLYLFGDIWSCHRNPQLHNQILKLLILSHNILNVVYCDSNHEVCASDSVLYNVSMDACDEQNCVSHTQLLDGDFGMFESTDCIHFRFR